MKNTLENKAKFFAQYWGQEVYGWHDGNTTNFQSLNITEDEFLILKPLSSISDEDAIKVAELAHQLKGGFKFVRKRDNHDIFLEKQTHSSIFYGVRIGLFYHGDISAWVRFEKTKDDKASQHDVNIGKINVSDQRPIPYIAIVDYLRSKGYALPWNGITVEEQIELGWIKLKNS